MFAGVAELVDALGLGPSGREAMGVRVPPPAPLWKEGHAQTETSPIYGIRNDTLSH